MNQEVYIDPELENMITQDKGYINDIDTHSCNTYFIIHYAELRVKKLMRLLRFGKIVSIVNHFDNNRGHFIYCVKLELIRCEK